MAFTTLKRGSKGDMVKALQYIVGETADEADGKVGKKTFEKIVTNAPTLRFGIAGAYVFALEAILTTMTLDGIYKEDEIAHVKTFQASKNIDVDGVVGKQTWSALFGLDAGNTVVTNNGANTKQPINYKQYDSRWGSVIYTKNNTYNKSQTIKSSGCGPTSMADILATWFNKDITPVETCKMSVDNGFRTSSSGTSWDFFGWVAKKYPFSKFVQTSSFVTMQACLAAGGLVVVSFRPSKWTKGGWALNGLLTR